MGLAMGTYAIIPALDTSKALDVVGDVDNRSANVYVNGYALDDGQFWFVWGAGRAGYPTGDHRTITCSLSGKALDVEIIGGLASGQNVVQYDPSTSPAQAWLPVADGKTLSFQGKTYPTYNILCSYDNSLALDIQGGVETTDYNIIVFKKHGADNQRFAFVPVPTLPNGYYSIRTVMDQSRCFDIANISQADGANCMVYSYNGGPNQIFVANTEFSGDRAGMTTLKACHSGKYLSTDSEDNVPGLNVRQWHLDASPTKLWLAQRYASVNRNGVDVPTYIFRHRNQTGYLLDVAGGSTELGTNVQVWPANASAAQQFELYPDLVFNPNLVTPAGFCLRYPSSYWNPSGKDQTGPWGNEGSASHNNGDGSWTTNFAFSFTGGGELMQMRYRVTYEEAITGSRRTTKWMNPADSNRSKDGLKYSTTNDGWGYKWRPNVRLSRDGSRWVTPFSIPFTVGNRAGQNRRLVIELEAYTYADDYQVDAYSGPSHSRLYSGRCTINYAPVGKITKVELGGWGYEYTVVSDWPTNGCSTALTSSSNGISIHNKKSISWLKKTDTPVVLIDQVKYIAPVGNIVASSTQTTPYGTSRDWTGNVALTHASRKSLNCKLVLNKGNYTYDVMVLQSEVTPRMNFVLNLGGKDKYGGYRVLSSVKTIGNGSVSGGYQKIASIMPPIGKTSHVFVGAGEQFDILDVSPISGSGAYMWNWGAGSLLEGFAMLQSELVDEPNTLEVTYSAELSEHVTSGRSRPVATFGKTTHAEYTVHGYIVEPLKHGGESVSALESLAHTGANGKNVTFRSRNGKVARVAIKSVSMTQQYDGLVTVDVSMSEVSA
jgi:hypothetical protein